MSRSIILIGAFLSSVACVILIALGLNNPAIGLIAETPVLDYGMLPQGSIVDASFEVRNEDADAVDIENIDGGCSCLSSQASPSHIEAGGKSIVAVKWAVGAARGNTSKQILVRYKDVTSPDTYSLLLTINADVLPDFNYEPKRLIFLLNRGAKQEIEIQPGRITGVGVNKAYCTHKAFTATIESKSRVRVDFARADWNQDEASSAYLILETTSINERVTRIPLLVK